MPDGRKLALLAGAVVVATSLLGCNQQQTAGPAPAVARMNDGDGLHLVGDYASLLSSGEVTVQGYGVVIGLGKNGSTEVPAHLQEYLRKFLLRNGLASHQAGTAAVGPDRFLRDSDTAIVMVAGEYPVGAQLGSKFDLFVRGIPGTQLKDLTGGVLLPVELFLAVGGEAVPGGRTVQWARGGGQVFVNPFADASNPADAAKLLEGRVLGGGVVMETRPLRLRLREPDYGRCVAIQRRINERFGTAGGKPVASAQNPAIIELAVPRMYQHDPEYFYQLVVHLPMFRDVGSSERHARQIAEQMARPSSDHESLAITWEAMGREVLPLLQTLYRDGDPVVRFYSARAALRLGDSLAMGTLIELARSDEPAMRLRVVEELGRHPNQIRARTVLREALDEPTESLRIAAFEGLVRHGDDYLIETMQVGKFTLDVVRSSGPAAIYAAQTGRPHLVIFGGQIPLNVPLFYLSPAQTVTISARQDEDILTAVRSIPRTGGLSSPVAAELTAPALVQALGAEPRRDDEGQFIGLGLSYGEVVSVVHHMCRRGSIPAKFVLQPLPEEQMIYRRLEGAGRPDMPGQ